MATGFNPLGASAYSNAPHSAMVQAAIPVKDWRYYEKTIIAMEEGTGKLYKEYKEGGAWKEQYKTWEDACVPLGKSRSQVDKIIAREDSIRSQCANTPTQQKKETLKAISKLPEPPEEPEKPHIKTRDEILEEQKEQPQANPKPLTDCTGTVISQQLLKTWNRRADVQGLMTLASDLKCAIDKLRGDNLFAGMLNIQIHIQNLTAIYFQLSQCKPGVVCPECDGTLKDDMGRECKECRLTGFISEHDWTHKWQKSSGSHQIKKVQSRATA